MGARSVFVSVEWMRHLRCRDSRRVMGLLWMATQARWAICYLYIYSRVAYSCLRNKHAEKKKVGRATCSNRLSSGKDLQGVKSKRKRKELEQKGTESQKNKRRTKRVYCQCGVV